MAPRSYASFRARAMTTSTTDLEAQCSHQRFGPPCPFCAPISGRSRWPASPSISGHPVRTARSRLGSCDYHLPWVDSRLLGGILIFSLFPSRLFAIEA